MTCSTTFRELIAIALAVLDCLVATLVYSKGVSFSHHLHIDMSPYSFKTATIELWFLSVLRTAVLLGPSFGVFCNRTDAVRRLQRSSFLVLVLATLLAMFTVIKMLICTEYKEVAGPWFWCEFGWSLFGCVMLYGGFTILCNIRSASLSNTVINENDDEGRSLLHENQTSSSAVTDVETEVKASRTSAKEKVSIVYRLVSYSKPDAHLIFVAFIFMVVSSVLEIFTPWYTGRIIQGIAIDKSEAVFTNAIIWMSIFSGGSAISAGIRGGFFKVAMARLNIRVRNALFSSIVHQEIGFFDITKTGDITSRLTSDTTTMSDALSMNLNIFVRSLIKCVGVCIFMFKLSWRLTLVTVVGLPVIMAVSKVYGEFYESLSKNVQDSLARANEVAEEVCSSMRTVRSFANELDEAKRYSERLDVTYGLKIKEAFAYAGYMWSNQLFSLSLVVAILYYGGHLVINGRMTGGDLISFVLYQMELGYTLESISNVFTGLMQAVGASQKVFEYIDRKPAISTREGKLSSSRLQGRVEFKNVSFAYPSRPDALVLKDVSFCVEPGEVVALVGTSGGGKSSCVNLLEHFYEPLKGEILLDGIPISQYEHQFLHRQIALVSQEPVLYGRSIKDNIAYGLRGEWDMGTICQAAIKANAHVFINEMKDQYDTEAGEKGAQLSGGQKQRIAIARAIVGNPAILLLDEATSALDSESEFMVQQAIYSNLKGRTVLIIAHRLSTVEHADRIVVIGGGVVLEQGTHTELLRRSDGVYAKLVQRQMLGLEIGIADDIPATSGLSRSSLSSIPMMSSSLKSIAVAIAPQPTRRRYSDAFIAESGGSNRDVEVGSLKHDPTL